MRRTRLVAGRAVLARREARRRQAGRQGRAGGRAAHPEHHRGHHGRIAPERSGRLQHLHGDLGEEGRAFPLAARHADPAAHRGDEALGDRQAEPGAAVAARGGVVGLREGREQARQRRLRDADPRIGDGEAQGAAGLGRLDADQHVAGFGELEGVVDEVAEHLPQAHGIARDGARHVRGDERREVEALGPRPLAEQRRHRVGDLRRIDRDALQLQLAGLDLREIEDVVDDRQQVLSGAGDHLRVAALAGRQVARGQEFGHHQHAVHRRADLVAHGGQEGRLGGVGGFRRLLGLAQVRGAVLHLLLQPRPVGGEPPVALVDRVEEAVEGRGECPDLVTGLHRHAVAVIVVGLDGHHGVRERRQRPGERRLQAPRDEEPHDHREPRRHGGGGQHVVEALDQVGGLGDERDAPDLAGVLHHRDAEAHGAGRDEVEDRDALRPVEVEVPGEAQPQSLLGERRPVRPRQRRVDDAGPERDRPQGRMRPRGILRHGGASAGAGEDRREPVQPLALVGGVARRLAPRPENGRDREGDQHGADDRAPEARGERGARGRGVLAVSRCHRGKLLPARFYGVRRCLTPPEPRLTPPGPRPVRPAPRRNPSGSGRPARRRRRNGCRIPGSGARAPPPGSRRACRGARW